jgi:phage FluMu gp28-like protein
MSAPVLYAYQRRYLTDSSRWKAACWSRQSGKTFTTTLEAVLDALEAEASGRLARWTILSISRDRAVDAMEAGVKLHLRAIGAAFEALEEPFEADQFAHVVKLPGGSYIRAVAANATTARGMSDNLILDEFAHHRDSRALWSALVPVVSRPGLRLRVISTPAGAGDMFHEIMTTGLGGLFSRHTVTLHDAVADGLPRDIEELKRAAADPDTFAQEFECAFLDRAGREWLTWAEIGPALEALPLAAYGGSPVFVGMDIAARGDLAVIAVLEADGRQHLVLRELVVMRGASFAAQLAELDRVMQSYRVVRAAIDQTGMGEMPVEEARRRHGSYRVAGVLFTPARKLELAVALKQRLQDRRLGLPVAATEQSSLAADLRAVRMEPGAGGLPRLAAPRTGAGHADRFWAIALACAAAGDGAPVYDYQPVTRRHYAGTAEEALPWPAPI